MITVLTHEFARVKCYSKTTKSQLAHTFPCGVCNTFLDFVCHFSCSVASEFDCMRGGHRHNNFSDTRGSTLSEATRERLAVMFAGPNALQDRG